MSEISEQEGPATYKSFKCHQLTWIHVTLTSRTAFAFLSVGKRLGVKADSVIDGVQLSVRREVSDDAIESA